MDARRKHFEVVLRVTFQMCFFAFSNIIKFHIFLENYLREKEVVTSFIGGWLEGKKEKRSRDEIGHCRTIEESCKFLLACLACQQGFEQQRKHEDAAKAEIKFVYFKKYNFFLQASRFHSKRFIKFSSFNNWRRRCFQYHFHA